MSEPGTVDVHIPVRKSINGDEELDLVRTVRAAGYRAGYRAGLRLQRGQASLRGQRPGGFGNRSC